MSRLPKDAGAIALLRGDDPLETWWIERSHTTPFLPGHRAFVGGRVEPGDTRLEIAGRFACDEQRLAAIAAIRELFEECGVLVARFERRPEPAELERAAAAANDGRPFAELLDELGARLDGELLTPAGRWVTPDFAPRRFDTWFFLAELPAGQQARVQTAELASGEWITPAAAIEQWQECRELVPPPVLHLLRSLAGGRGPEMVERARRHPQAEGHPIDRIEFYPGIVLVPLRTDTLPPAHHTNCYVVGREQALILDPGSAEPAEGERLLRVLGQLEAEGVRPLAVVLSHHHRDHVQGCAWLLERTGLPLWAHRATARRLPNGLQVARELADGERIALGAGYEVEVVHTPGHAPGHLVLLEHRTGALLTADNVVGLGTVLIDPPDGEMRLYLASLERMKKLPASAIFGGHGPPLPNPADRIQQLIDHRLWRESEVLAALAAGRGDLESITRYAYRDAPEKVLPLAERQVLAHLEGLAQVGRVRFSDGRYESC